MINPIAILLGLVFAVTCSPIGPKMLEASLYEDMTDTTLSNITVYHDECTGCADIIVESGVVNIPDSVRAGFRPRKGKGELRPATLSAWSMRLESDSVFNVLFGPPDNYRFERRYQLLGAPIGLRDSAYLIFKIYGFRRLNDREL